MDFQKLRIAVLVSCSVAGCSSPEESHSTIIEKQVGRFSMVAAQDGFPPLVLDTAAGCLMALSKDADGGVTIDEVEFPEGTTSCKASKQLLIVDTLGNSN